LPLHWLPLGFPVKVITRFPCNHGASPRGFLFMEPRAYHKTGQNHAPTRRLTRRICICHRIPDSGIRRFYEQFKKQYVNTHSPLSLLGVRGSPSCKRNIWYSGIHHVNPGFSLLNECGHQFGRRQKRGGRGFGKSL
jgi:hypothetical protein